MLVQTNYIKCDDYAFWFDATMFMYVLIKIIVLGLNGFMIWFKCKSFGRVGVSYLGPIGAQGLPIYASSFKLKK